MSGAWKGGSTRQWRTIRARVLLDNQQRNGGRCQLAIPRVCTGYANSVHHTHGRAYTGDDPRYMVAACMACNQHVGDPTKTKDPQPKPMTKW